MKPTKDIERSIRNVDWDMEVHAKTDRKIQNELVEAHRQSVRTPPAAATLAWRAVTESWIMRLAAAAAMVGIVVLLTRRHVPREPRVIAPPGATMSAADMLTVGQLKAAYHRGGLGGLEAQCEQAAAKVDMATMEMSLEGLIVELKGSLAQKGQDDANVEQ